MKKEKKNLKGILVKCFAAGKLRIKTERVD